MLVVNARQGIAHYATTLPPKTAFPEQRPVRGRRDIRPTNGNTRSYTLKDRAADKISTSKATTAACCEVTEAGPLAGDPCLELQVLADPVGTLGVEFHADIGLGLPLTSRASTPAQEGLEWSPRKLLLLVHSIRAR